jgi:cytochrome b6-f complex iron-sulfur subunit
VKGLGFFGRARAPRTTVTCQAGSIAADRVPDMEKRKLMNLLLLGAISLPTVGMVVPYGSFFVPGGSVSQPPRLNREVLPPLLNLLVFSSSGNAGSGTVAKDKLGNDIKVDEWLKTHGPNDRTLAQGLKVSDDHGD